MSGERLRRHPHGPEYYRVDFGSQSYFVVLCWNKADARRIARQEFGSHATVRVASMDEARNYRLTRYKQQIPLEEP